MTVPPPHPRRARPLAAGPLAPEIVSFRLYLAAEGKAPKTVRTYTEAVAWFAAAHLISRTSHARWEQVSSHDVQRWMIHLLTRYSDAYASNQFRALQQFFRWLADEEQLPDPMTGLHGPRWARSWCWCSPAKNYRPWIRPARPALSSVVMRRSSRCSPRPGSGPRSWPGSATTPTRGAVTWSCGGGRSRCTERAAGPGGPDRP